MSIIIFSSVTIAIAAAGRWATKHKTLTYDKQFSHYAGSPDEY